MSEPVTQLCPLSMAPWAAGFPRQEYEQHRLPHPLLGISLTQGSNTGGLHRRRILYQLSHQGSPKRRAQGSKLSPDLQTEGHNPSKVTHS